MPRGWQWPVVLAGTFALAACGGVTTVRLIGGANYSAAGYVQTAAQNGTNAVVVRNSPFPADAVLAALRARYQGNQYRFALGTPPDWNGYTLILAFGGPPAGSQSLCANPNLPQPASPGGVVELMANFCYGNRLVGEALSRAPALTGPDDPNFRKLIGQTIAELLINQRVSELVPPNLP